MFPTSVTLDHSRVIDRIAEAGLVPVVQIASVALAEPLAEALLKGGLECIEITFRTGAAAGSIEAMRRSFPGLLLGAGTILSTEQASIALQAGAEFIVAPGMNPKVVDHCHRLQATVIPGVCTPTEIELALAHDVSVAKFFPAAAMGGVALLRAFSGPYPHVRFIPTGGVDSSNLRDYLALPNVLACGGSWMVRPELLAAQDFAQITRLASEAVALVRTIRRQ